jgi:ABC-2 type transport system permease protein
MGQTFFLCSLLAITVSMLIKDHGSQAQVNTFVITPMIFLCGTFFPVDKLQAFFKVIVHALPLTYSTKVIRASLTGGEINYTYIGIIMIFMCAFFLTALYAVKKVEA